MRTPTKTILRSLAAAGFAAVSALAGAQGAAPAPAAQPVAEPTAGDLRGFGQRWIEAAMAQGQARVDAPLRLEVAVGELDSRLQLAPCARIEPYLPNGMRLWGRSRVGLRCVEGPVRWNVFLPVTVKAWGPAWVLRQTVPAGTMLTEADAERGEADWAAQPSAVVQDPAQWIGMAAGVTLSAGQPLRAAQLRAPQAFGAGASVRLVVDGSGFSISTEGYALSPGYVGQGVRVRTESGRVVGGTVLDARTVRLSL